MASRQGQDRAVPFQPSAPTPPKTKSTAKPAAKTTKTTPAAPTGKGDRAVPYNGPSNTIKTKSTKPATTKNTTPQVGGRTATKTRILHVMQMSCRFDRPESEFRSDMNYACDQDPDVVGMTEIDLGHAKRAIRDVCEKRGYIPVLFGRGDSGFMVKKGGDAAARVMDRSTTQITSGIPGVGLPAHLAVIKISWWGETIWFHEAHWASGVINPATPNFALRVRQHEQMTRAVCAAVKKHGEKDDFAFFMGDINIDEGYDNRKNARNMPNYIFRESGLLTIWDEFKVVPQPTLNSSVFDIVGSYTPDKQVVGKRWKVHPKKHSDHSYVSAFYEVPTTTVVKGSSPTKTTPTAGDKTGDQAKDDFYATGGNVNWSDYLDPEQYKLNQAVDDSDSYNG